MDVIEEEDTLVAYADVASDNDDGSYGEPEMQDIECISEGEQEAILDMFPAEIEDLGKRKGTNPARDQIVKKLRETPPNADVNMGGYKEIPVQKMPNLSRGTYKTYRAVPDKKVIAKQQGKDVLSKPVAVPLNHFMGVTLLASQDKNRLIHKLTKDATSVLDAYVDTLEVPEVDLLELAPVQAGSISSNAVRQTLYVPILFPKCSTPQWALVDSGAQLSLITTGCA